MSMGKVGRTQQHVLSEHKPVGSGQMHWLASLLAHMTNWTNHSTRCLLPKQISWKAWEEVGMDYCTERVRLESSK